MNFEYQKLKAGLYDVPGFLLSVFLIKPIVFVIILLTFKILFITADFYGGNVSFGINRISVFCFTDVFIKSVKRSTSSSVSGVRRDKT